MAKLRIQFEELVTYELVIETDLTPEQLEDMDTDGDEQWFELVNAQHPGWPAGADGAVQITVDERTLLTVDNVED
jgi:hypothetical protein